MSSPLLKQLLLGTQAVNEDFVSEISDHVSAFANAGVYYLVSVGGGNRLTVSNISNLATASVVNTYQLDLIAGAVTAQSVAVYRDLVAVAVQPSSSATATGAVQFWRIRQDGSLTYLSSQAVGVLPDSIKFTTNGLQLVVANEGQPNADYSQDPQGSISVLDIKDRRTDLGSSGINPLIISHTLLDFNGFVAPTRGILDGSALRFSSSIPGSSSFAADLEPEAMTIRDGYAYVTLQEANGIAKVNLATRSIEALSPLGAANLTRQFVDLTDNGSASPSFGNLLNGNPVLGLRMPDGIASFRTAGTTYLITANEGDTRTDYGSTYYDEFRPSASASPDVYSIRDGLADGSSNYRTNGTGSQTVFGSRSISIHRTDGTVVWDSGSLLQSSAIALGIYDDGRSDTKGVEPEMVVVGSINGRRYAFVGTERTTTSMVSVFDISKPVATTFVTSIKLTGSRSPEGMLFIPAAKSPSGDPLLVVSNEVSNTLDFIDAEALVAQGPLLNRAGSVTTPMLIEAAGGPDLSFRPLLTIGESTKNNYIPTGILDGLGAFDNRNGTFTVLASHELSSSNGYGYHLPGMNAGEELTGARISRFTVTKDIDNDPSNGFQSQVTRGALAYREIIDAAGQVVTQASQLNGGLNRFCSGSFVQRASFGAKRGFVNDLYLTGEESSEGLMYALDVHASRLHAVPALGRAGWENATLVDTGSRNTVAVFLADDSTAAPLLWVGQKDPSSSNFLRRNGLDTTSGSLYTWTPTLGSIGTAAGDASLADSADLLACSLGTDLTGRWVLVGSGTQVASWNEATLKAQVKAPGGNAALAGLQLSRLEDIHTNPQDGQQLVLATTGNADFSGADRYGNLMVFDFSNTFTPAGTITTGESSLRLVYDGDRLGGLARQEGIRNPDNLTWSADGNLYVQEDRSVSGGTADGQFGAIEASIWKLNPFDPILNAAGVAAQRWAVIDPTNGVPQQLGQTNANPSSTPANVGNWESSGIIDVSSIYGLAAGSMMLADVQAHSLRDGNIGGASHLVEGGQLLLIGSSPSSFG
jgi:Bacterial protein of unknown function (DUF839)